MFKSRKSLAEFFDVSVDTVKRREEEMKKLPEIYGRKNFTADPPRIKQEAFEDYLRRRVNIRLGIDTKAFVG